MSIVAAFYWNKHPRGSISVLIFDASNAKILLKPKIYFFPDSYFSFRSEVKECIKNFFIQVAHFQRLFNTTVTLGFRILFNISYISYIFPSKESQFVYKTFCNFANKTKRIIKFLNIKPQLRNKLKGKHLKHFKRALRAVYLVSRKKETNFEYHLWAIALHATPATYEEKLDKLRVQLIDSIVWNEKF